MPEQPEVRKLDARSLRGLAHPLRMELLNALRRHGPATASQLAERLGESSGATSYHLRQLAAHGFVADDPERGKGRERWWKAAVQGIAMDEKLFQSPDPEVRGAADTFLHEIANKHARELATWVATRDAWLPKWSDHAMDLSDWQLRLTPERARELVRDMHELLRSYEALEAGENDPEAEQIRLHTHVFPITTDRERSQ
ncbi:ArsR/SmtB family transcription factor [Streptomyces zaehneri]|uniref:ArsR/SmtB family transcription factor n=1 Tax=Streptomyces zaehneri TaxID=3051180 RepID=UPI0028D7869E|nr:helix-turn-helix domain-containing protein [Streptomyces sp. DSM 40713]